MPGLVGGFGNIKYSLFSNSFYNQFKRQMVKYIMFLSLMNATLAINKVKEKISALMQVKIGAININNCKKGSCFRSSR